MHLTVEQIVRTCEIEAWHFIAHTYVLVNCAKAHVSRRE